MEESKKKLLHLPISEINDIADRCSISECPVQNGLFKIIHRYNGVSDSFLRNSLHWHDYYELEFVYEGEGTHILTKSCHRMLPGFVCLRTPHSLHSTIQDANRVLKLYNIKFSENFIPEDIAAHLISSNNSLWVNYTENELKQATRQIKRIIGELNRPDTYSLSVMKAIFTDLFITFIRKCQLDQKTAEYSNPHIQKVLQSIQNRFREDLSLKQLAKENYLTPNYLGNLFIKETGKTCSAYLRDLRFSFAIQLLLNTNLSVKEITDECGFHSTSYFIRKFKEIYSVPPMEYRSLQKDRKGNFADEPDNPAYQ